MDNKLLSILSLTHMHNVLLYTYLKKKNRRWWVRYINQQRQQLGVYNMFKELYCTDEEQFFEYTRMDIR